MFAMYSAAVQSVGRKLARVFELLITNSFYDFIKASAVLGASLVWVNRQKSIDLSLLLLKKSMSCYPACLK